MELQRLINLQAHYKLKADIQHEQGNFDESKAYDDLAKALDEQILDLLVEAQELRVKLAIVA
jgi:hypothetical protein